MDYIQYYAVIIEPPKNDNEAWGVTVPDLEGCFSAGDTYQEAVENAEEAIKGYIELLIDDNEEIPDNNASVQYLSGKPENRINVVMDIRVEFEA